MPKSEYWDDVRSIAEEIREEYPNPRRHHNERVEAVTENVDGSEWIIYTANHEIVLRETDNEPDDRDVRAMSGEDADWRTMRQTAAFLAMEMDVHKALRELDREAEEAEEEEETEA